MRILEVNDIRKFQKVAKSLSTDVRVRIYELLQSKERNIQDISEILDIPSPTVSNTIKMMEKLDLIKTEKIAAEKGGLQKICSLNYDQILFNPKKNQKPETIITMPVGNFVSFDVSKPCGLASDIKIIGKFDHIPSFYQADKTDAQIIWFTQGYLEYHFPNEILEYNNVKEISFSAELCSEAKGYNEDYPSDITLWINNIEVGTWTSPGDFGGKQGKFTPKWWKQSSTQYGLYKTWKITSEGCFIDKKKVSLVHIKSLQLQNAPFISIKLGVKADADHVGGMNVFGSKFGNNDQDLILKITYIDTKGKKNE